MLAGSRREPGTHVSQVYLLTLAVAGLAIAAGLILAPGLGDLVFPSDPLKLFPSLANPAANQPEPTEFTRFVIAALAPIVVVAGTFVLARRPIFPESAGRLIRIAAPILSALIAAGLIATWIARDTIDPTFHTSDEYFSNREGLFALIFAVALAWAATRPVVRDLCSRALQSRALRVISPILAVLITVTFLLPDVQTNATYASEHPFVSFHFVDTLADFEGFANGSTPGVDFAPEYTSLLPYALGPLFDAVNFEPGAVISILCLLTAAIFLAFYRVLVLVTRSALAALALFVPVLALSLIPIIDGAPLDLPNVDNANSFAVLPLRYLGPALVALLFARHLHKQGGATGRRATFLVAGLAAISTPDYGIASVIAAGFGFLVLAAGEVNARDAVRRVLADALLGLAGAIVAFSALTLIRSGSLPSLSLLAYFPRLFGSRGFGLIPMDTVALHWFLYVTFAGAMVLSAVRSARGESDRVLTGALAFFSAMGLAAGVYYVGRSNPFTLIADFPLWGMTIALLAWIVIREIAEGTPEARALARIGPLRWLILFGIGLSVSAIGAVQSPIDQIDRLRTSDDMASEFDAVGPLADYVAARTEPGEKVAVLCRNGYLIADRAGVRNTTPAADPGQLLEEDQIRFVSDHLRERNGSQIFTCGESFIATPAEYGGAITAEGFAKADDDADLKITDWALP